MCLLVAVAAFVGCSAANEPLAVSGTVTGRDGQPVGSENAQVVFEPTTPEGRRATVTLEADGTFSSTPSDAESTVLPGQYKVLVFAYKSYRDATLISPKKYTETETTPLEATVDASHTNFDFEVQ